MQNKAKLKHNQSEQNKTNKQYNTKQENKTHQNISKLTQCKIK